MFEYHGWLTIESDLTDNGGSVDNFELITQIREYALSATKELSGGGKGCGAEFINGSLMVWFNGNRNHKGLEHKEVINIIEFIISRASYSYGLLYLRDDEDEQNRDSFQVYRIAGGKFERQVDSFLSPCSKIIGNL